VADGKKGITFGFDMYYEVDLKSVLNRIVETVEDTMDATARIVEEDAKHLAPVRRVVKGNRGGKTRRLSAVERHAEQAVRRRLGLRSGRVINTAAESRKLKYWPSNPYLRAPGRRPPRADPPELTRTARAFAPPSGVELNRFGRAELARGKAITGPTIFGRGSDKAVAKNRAALRRSNSAIYYKPGSASSITEGLRGSGKYTLGGRLRGEIYTEESSASDRRVIKYWIISPTYYARFVEFGTRHAKAQPFLRPALAKARRKLASTLKTNLRKMNWKPKRKHVRTR
jgi:HK97 gp10 family phage protein